FFPTRMSSGKTGLKQGDVNLCARGGGLRMLSKKRGRKEGAAAEARGENMLRLQRKYALPRSGIQGKTAPFRQRSKMNKNTPSSSQFVYMAAIDNGGRGW
ncbi:MAG: hypothetical protein IIW18_04975, partial [Oscillospiraceae bacterium]|nr:hypothetical protein [Oscillospiraceae bacterium]